MPGSSGVAAAAGGASGGGLVAVGSGALLAGVITAYDAWHKANPLSPVVMGLCRVLVYVTAALAVAGRIGPAVLGGALVLLCYLIGLTYVAKQENLTELRHLWPLAFLSAPFLYAWPALLTPGLATVLYLGFLAWVARAVAGLVRPGRRDIRRAVVSLIAGISLARRAPHRRPRRPVPGGVGRPRLRADARVPALGARYLIETRRRP